MIRPRIVASVAACALLAGATAGLSYSTYAKWPSATATFFVNPTNSDVSASAAATAFQYALDVWNTQSGSSFRYQYGGTVSDTSTAHDNRNVLIFRNSTNGSSIGTTYSWWDSNNRLLDSDIIIWDAGFTFFTGTSGCGVVSNAAYFEDVATHELGHALGLNHSTYTDATMYPSYSYCSQAFRTLSNDDIAGVKALYPGTAPANASPTVTITSPANGASYLQGSAISFSASALDAEDGNLSSNVQWTDNGAVLGTGSVLSKILSVIGTHTIGARVTDSAGAQGTSQVVITVTAPPAGDTAVSPATLSAVGYKVKGWAKADLSWSGLTSSYVDVYRNSVKVKTVSNTNRDTDSIQTKGSGTYTYKVCAAATATCTNTATVTF